MPAVNVASLSACSFAAAGNGRLPAHVFEKKGRLLVSKGPTVIKSEKSENQIFGYSDEVNMLQEESTSTRKYQVQVRSRGQMTIPHKVRVELDIEDGDTLTLIQVGDAFVLTPRMVRSPQYAAEFSDLMKEKGLSLADLLEDLPQIREEIYTERYGSADS